MKDTNHTDDLIANLAIRLRLDQSQKTQSADQSPRRAPEKSAKQQDYHSKLRQVSHDTAQRRQTAASSLMSDWKTAHASSNGSLAKLRNLETDATLLLLTPIMLPSGHPGLNRTIPDIDTKSVLGKTHPFEMLGLALSKQHRKIRHVPYVPSVGFTHTHEVFLTKSDAVIVVSCEPDSGPTLELTLAKQAEFVGNVADALEESDRQLPMVNVSFGGDDWENEAVSYSHLWAGEQYDLDTVQNVVMLIFGSRK
ncbi:hypothetical protein LTR78_009206 [Recurvomyces mirabilis]|uniref:Uncharacterized protein n=1 Tax=Recurvomyces mirabilis TaxID=574656 RepID=A0AAE0WIR1_9PEZI|nr:hypothetical protein LTR78_009206 [Recurvomyces mirabilis]KAK5155634.1 hypothetical protein LTS14_005895 [Recurvomyces mirabilis]